LEVLIWFGFVVLILLLLGFDLGLHKKEARVVPTWEALAWTGFYVALALGFSVLVFFLYEENWMEVGIPLQNDLSGMDAAIRFFTAWLLEWSLALDNVFVIALIFGYFQVPARYQHRVLFWGILGALGFRAIMIVGGVALIRRFDWIIYVFGVLLLFTAIRLLVARHDNMKPGKNPLVRLLGRWLPVTDEFRGSSFLAVENGRLHLTPLAVALVVVESSDLLFAVDSIPAAFAVTTDPFLVFTSNIFAVLGLRSLYFALAGLLDRFRYLKMSLVFILAFVGMKLLLSHHFPMPAWVSLVVIAGFLSVGILASVFHEDTAPILSPLQTEMEALATVTLRQVRRVIILTIGATLLILGIVMVIAPGPGFITVFLSLAILGVEFAWARAWLARTRTLVEGVKGDLGRSLRRVRPGKDDTARDG